MSDAAKAREILRRGMFYTPPALLRPLETTMTETTFPDAVDITAAVDKALAAVRCAGRPAAGNDLHALAKAWIQHAADAGVLVCRMESLRIQLAACRRLQKDAAETLGMAAFADHEADGRDAFSVAGGTGVVIVRMTGDADEPYACEFVPSAK